MSEAALPEPSETPTNPAWPYWAAGVLTAMKTRPSLTQAAHQAGVARSTVQRLQQKDPAFAEAMQEARDEALDTMEEVCRIRATTGQAWDEVTEVTRTKATGEIETIKTTVKRRHFSDNLLMFYLKRFRPEFRDTYRVEQTGKDGGPIEFEEKLRDAEDRFAAGVIRLADHRRAGDAPS